MTQAGGAQTGGAQAAAPEGADPAASVLAAIRFDANGLVPAIAQQHDTGEVLMMAWMNPDSIRETLATARVCYYSRSRGGLWRKGETSGQTQHLRELRVDCDGDTLLLLVQQDGVACHTGRRSCFFRAARDGDLVEIAAPEVSPEALYGQAGCGHPHG
ncbi:phosphoribosyl-AMP cyclohydrolase [Rhodopila sp.]|uniref:phosphoribosyl-AMP cyclohydrolase n=1 Tax=Rhodopila sp. TaxID=2480087 RepID=UPI002B5EFE42|nr:phosphoribosyl-AMP cyclohydrolase [Rhodopila sp.]HVZ07043.1 phosphoribosyl-AMP cyclohydrolase [Rhodopila sp.]